jgi:hypothetical protein
MCQGADETEVNKVSGLFFPVPLIGGHISNQFSSLKTQYIAKQLD